MPPLRSGDPARLWAEIAGGSVALDAMLRVQRALRIAPAMRRCKAFRAERRISWPQMAAEATQQPHPHLGRLSRPPALIRRILAALAPPRP